MRKKLTLKTQVAFSLALEELRQLRSSSWNWIVYNQLTLSRDKRKGQLQIIYSRASMLSNDSHVSEEKPKTLHMKTIFIHIALTSPTNFTAL